MTLSNVPRLVFKKVSLFLFVISLSYVSTVDAAYIYQFTGNVRYTSGDENVLSEVNLSLGTKVDLSVYIDFTLPGEASDSAGNLLTLNGGTVVDGYTTDVTNYAYAAIESSSFDYSTYSSLVRSSLDYAESNSAVNNSNIHVSGANIYSGGISLASNVSIRDRCDTVNDAVCDESFYVNNWGASRELTMSYVFNDEQGNLIKATTDVTLVSIRDTSVAPVPVPAALWLFLSGFVSLLITGKKLQANKQCLS